ncbi:hypothetical protein [Porticoccus sp.]
MTPYQKAGFNGLTLLSHSPDNPLRGGEIVWISEDDGATSPIFANVDGEQLRITFRLALEELPKDADGFYLWKGGECPVPGDWVVQVKTQQAPIVSDLIRRASEWNWSTGINPITAFKPLRRPDTTCAVADVACHAVTGADADLHVEVDEAFLVTEAAPRETAPLEKEIRAMCEEMAEFLVGKNRSYGNSAAQPVRVFAKGMSPTAQIDVRIDDKINRMMQGGEYPGDDTVRDLAGYLILRMIVAGEDQ